jgi:pimeloyl-ACP methyl ester carboxylesterase
MSNGTGFRQQAVEFASGDVRLQGRVFFPSEGTPPFPGVVLCHGLTSDHREMDDAARDLARRGMAALTFNLRGHGPGSSVCGRGMLEDVPVAYGYLASLPQVDGERIALAGHSMGARLALAAARELGTVSALVLLACPADIRAEEREEFRQFCWNLTEDPGGFCEYPRHGVLPWTAGWERPLGRLWMWLTGRRLRINWQEWGQMWEQMQSGEILPKMRSCPVLFGHCLGDRNVTPEAAEELYQLASSPKKLLLWEGGSHSAPIQAGELRQEWVDWLAETMEI